MVSKGQWLPFDRLVLGYSLLMLALVAAFGRPFSDFWDELLFYGGTIALTAFIVRNLGHLSGRAAEAARLMYPALLFTFFYRMTGGSMFLLYDHFLDDVLTGFEYGVLGVHPTLFIDQHLLNELTSEILSFWYFSYYLMIPLYLLYVYLRRDLDVLQSSITAFCAIFFVSYLLFFLFPIEGPRWHFADQYQNQVNSPVFRKLTQLIITKAAVRGGCMPSSHFAIALSILMYCWRHYRHLAYWLVIPVIGLGIGTVWGRYHYVTDVVVGGVIGAGLTWLVWRLTCDGGKTPALKPTPDVAMRKHVT